MPDEHIAHIAADGRIQTVLDHLLGTANLAREFAEAFGAGPDAYIAGLYHDIGKYSRDFQIKIKTQNHSLKVDHSTAGALASLQKYGQLPIALAIAGHHGQIPELGTQCDTAQSPTLYGRRLRTLPDCSAYQTEIAPYLTEQPVYQSHGHIPDDIFYTRMLYSCLVDADYLDTEQFMQNQSRSETNSDMALLNQKLDQYTAPWASPTNRLNKLRNQILDHCRTTGASSAPGHFTLTVPTGGGKTITSVAFALRHAVRNNMRRIIYVIPYTSIIEQTAAVFRDIFGESAVLEHHSGKLYDRTNEYSMDYRAAQATENWDMPVVITTAVQFFESLYSAHPDRCRKLHNIANSVIIFDEAQMLPLPYLRPCVYAIDQLVRHYRCTAVLCTATQPALGPVFERYGDYHPTEICPPDIATDPIFRRVTLEHIGVLDLDTLCIQLHQHDQVLCIVNTRKTAQELYARLKDDDVYHLSTLMYPHHRKETLATIRQRLKDGLPCKIISTSLIEAGVDIDVPRLYREESGLDSILQAAGRCNREGSRDPADSLVSVFSLGEKPPALFSRSIHAYQSTRRNHDDITSQDAIRDYFYQWRTVSGDKAQDKHGIMDDMFDPVIPIRTIERKCRLIDTDTVTIYIPTQDSIPLLDRLRRFGPSRGLYRQLDPYSIAVYPQHFERLQAAGALECVDDSWILRDLTRYDNATGLQLDIPSGEAVFI